LEHLTDKEFEEQFANCSLAPEYFTHLGHVRLAWIHLCAYGLEVAITHLCEQIRAFDAVKGDGTKFHKTLTVAAVQVVHHFRQRSQASTFNEFIKDFPQIKTGFRELIAHHYSAALLRKAEARSTFLEPDLLPFD